MNRLALLVLLPALTSSAGCDMRGCVCHEALQVERTYQSNEEQKRFKLGQEQLGPGAFIEMKIPPRMNASLCVC